MSPEPTKARTPAPRRWVVRVLGLMVALALAGLVALLAYWRAASGGTALGLDRRLMDGLARIWFDPLTPLARAVYGSSGVTVTGALVAGVLALLLWRRRWADVVAVALGCAGVLVTVDLVLKPWFALPRPSGRLVVASGWGFPSGHAAGAMVFYPLLAVIAAARWPALRLPVALATATWIGAILVSSLHVRAHWPSDLVAGMMVGLIWLLIALAARRRMADHIDSRTSL